MGKGGPIRQEAHPFQPPPVGEAGVLQSYRRVVQGWGRVTQWVQWMGKWGKMGAGLLQNLGLMEESIF